MSLKTLYVGILLILCTCGIIYSQVPKADFGQQNLSCLFNNSSMTGVLGNDCSRIDIRFKEAQKVNDKQYKIKGVSRTRLSIICPFWGEVYIDSISCQPQIKSEYTKIDGFIYGHYLFREKGDRRYSGAFSGVFKQAYSIDNKRINKGFNEIPELKINLAEYVGKWESPNGAAKACSWSDAVIPSTPANFCKFNDAGEWIVLPQYRKNGWDNLYNAYHNDYLSVDEIQKAQTKEEQEWWIN